MTFMLVFVFRTFTLARDFLFPLPGVANDHPAWPAVSGLSPRAWKPPVVTAAGKETLVAKNGREEQMDLQRYDIQTVDEVWRERYWLPVNSPVKDAAGRCSVTCRSDRQRLAVRERD